MEDIIRNVIRLVRRARSDEVFCGLMKRPKFANDFNSTTSPGRMLNDGHHHYIQFLCWNIIIRSLRYEF